MAASYQSKDSQVLGQQLKVQELVLFANNPLISDDTTNLIVAIGEPVSQVLMCIKQVVGGTISGLHATASGSTIILPAETGAASTTSYMIKYVINEQA